MLQCVACDQRKPGVSRSCLKNGTRTASRLMGITGWVDDALRKEVTIMFVEIVMFILSALGFVAAGSEVLRRGHNLGLWA